MEMRSTSFWTSWWRLAGVAGVVFGVAHLAFAGWYIGVEPAFDAPASEFRDFFANDASMLLTIGFVGALLSFFALTLFASGLRGILGRAEGGSGMWSRLVFAGAVMGATIGTLGMVFSLGIGMAGHNALNDPMLQLFAFMDEFVFTMIFLALGLMALAAAVVIIRSHVLNRWFGWLGLLAAAFSAFGASWMIDGTVALWNFLGIGSLLTLLWVTFVGIEMTFKKELPPHIPGEGLFTPAETKRIKKGEPIETIT